MRAHDPEAMANVRAIYGDKRALVRQRCTRAAEGADALVLVTEWHEYRRPDFHAPARGSCVSRRVFDGRNIWDPDELRALGFSLHRHRPQVVPVGVRTRPLD